MAKTRRALIDQVLDNVGVLIPGQAPSDESVEKVDFHIDPTLAELAALEILYVPEPGTPSPPAGGEYADEIVLSLADVITWNVAGSFNLSNDPALKVLNDQAEETLRRIARPARSRKYLTTDIQLRAGNRRYAVFNYTTGR